MIWTITANELYKQFRMKSLLFIMFLLPIVLIFLLGTSLSGTGGFRPEQMKMERIHVGVVQEDNGKLGHEAEAFLRSDMVAKWIEPVFLMNREEIVQQVKDGKLDFGLLVPAGFTDHVNNGKSASWEMIMGSSYGNNMAARSILGSFLDTVNTQQANVISARNQGSPPIELIRDDALQSRNLVQVNALDTSVMPSAMQYYAVSIMIMFMLYAGMALALSLMSDKQIHTFDRILAAPIRPYQYIAGKMVANTLFALIQAASIIGLSHWLLGVEWGNPWMLAIISLLVVLCSLGIGVIAIALVHTERAVKGLFQFIIMTMTALSGGFVPISSLQSSAGPFTISHWAMQSMLRIMMGDTWEGITPYVSTLAIITFIIIIVTIWSSRRVVTYAKLNDC